VSARSSIEAHGWEYLPEATTEDRRDVEPTSLVRS